MDYNSRVAGLGLGLECAGLGVTKLGGSWDVHYIAKSIRSSSYKHEWHPILIWCRPTLCSYNSFNSSRRLSTRFRSVFMGIFDHSSRSALRGQTDIGWEGLAHSLRSKSSQRCSIGLRWGLCAGQSSSSTPNLIIHVFMAFALCTWFG